jgi:NADPH:quinone reductase-like Zn-dependent oxidoreductase
MLWWKPFDRDDLATVEKGIAAGKVKPVIDRRFPLSEIVEALRYVDEGRPRGMVIIEVAGAG